MKDKSLQLNSNLIVNFNVGVGEALSSTYFTERVMDLPQVANGPKGPTVSQGGLYQYF